MIWSYFYYDITLLLWTNSSSPNMWLYYWFLLWANITIMNSYFIYYNIILLIWSKPVYTIWSYYYEPSLHLWYDLITMIQPFICYDMTLLFPLWCDPTSWSSILPLQCNHNIMTHLYFHWCIPTIMIYSYFHYDLTLLWFNHLSPMIWPYCFDLPLFPLWCDSTIMNQHYFYYVNPTPNSTLIWPCFYYTTPYFYYGVTLLL